MQEQQALRTYLKQQVSTASPGQLVVMLYDGAIRHCNQAKAELEAKRVSQARRHLVKAQDIVGELMATLNVEAGGELGTQLYRLYDYLFRRIVQANVRRDPAAVDEVVARLTELREAWAAVATGAGVAALSPPRGPVA